MSKYITHFQTESEYQTALPSIELPNVSLVDELGEVHYHRALYGAHAGDICLYDVAEGQKFFVTANNWNLTSYPTASYPIIGVAVADESVTGVTLVSTHYFNTDGSKSLTPIQLKWQNTAFDWGLTKYATADAAKNDFNGKSNTTAIIAAIKAYDITNNTDNITGNIGQGIQAFAPTGTNAGDWYIPSVGELDMWHTNVSTVAATLQKIKDTDSSLAVVSYPTNTYFFFSSTEANTSNFHVFGTVSYSTQKTTTYAQYHTGLPFYKLT